MDYSGWNHTQFDELLFRAFDRFAIAAANDDNIEGEYNVLDAFMAGVVASDEVYRNRLAALKEKHREGSLSARDLMWRHVALMMERARYHGRLDVAPKPQTRNGIDFLSQ